MNTQHRKVSIVLVSVIVIAAIIVFGTTLVHAVFYAPDGSETAQPIDSTVDSGIQPPAAIQPTSSSSAGTISSPGTPAKPSELIIPAISVDAHVQYVGLAYSGNMGVPNNFTDVAWYKNGPIPGQMGSAVMDGHVDNGLSLAGVFKHLEDVKVGDDIYVVTVTGQKLHFVISDVTTFSYHDAPVQQIFNENDKAYLKLITCTGGWVQSDRTYDHRLLVTAVLQP